MQEPERRPIGRSDATDQGPEAAGPPPSVRPRPEAASVVDPVAAAAIARGDWMRPQGHERGRWWVRALWFTAAAGVGMGFALILASFH